MNQHHHHHQQQQQQQQQQINSIKTIHRNDDTRQDTTYRLVRKLLEKTISFSFERERRKRKDKEYHIGESNI